MFEMIPNETPSQIQEAANLLLTRAAENGGSIRYTRNAGAAGTDDWALYNKAARWLEQRGKGRLVNGNFKFFDFYTV